MNNNMHNIIIHIIYIYNMNNNILYILSFIFGLYISKFMFTNNNHAPDSNIIKDIIYLNNNIKYKLIPYEI